MGKIFILLGKSSTGKDTVFKELLQCPWANVKPVVSYTTRPMRSHECYGREYYFIDEAMLAAHSKAGKVIEQREYNTIKGKWYYCTIDDGQIDLMTHNYLLIGTLEAFNSLKRYFGAENVMPLYLELDDGERLERAVKRERMQSHPNYEELCRRFLADSDDFSSDKLAAAGITTRYYNHNLSQCLAQLKEVLYREGCREAE